MKVKVLKFYGTTFPSRTESRLLHVDGDGTAYISSARPSKRAAGWISIEEADLERLAAEGYDLWYRPATGGGRREIYARHPENSRYAKSRGLVDEEGSPLTTTTVEDVGGK